MTNSYKVKPQRQVRDRVALPGRPKELARPAAPLEIPQQVGGQLIDRREYVEDRSVAQGLQAIQTWSGVAGKTIKNLGEERWKDAKRSAENLIKQETYALEQSLKNASEAEKLRAKKAFEEARYVQLKNPYINFNYYGTKANEAAALTSTKLTKWGTDNAGRLARIESPSEKAALIAAEADELKKQYSYLPKNWIEAKIDPALATATVGIKKAVAEAELDVAQETVDQTIRAAIVSPLLQASEYSTVGGTTERGVEYAEGAFLIAYMKGLDAWRTAGQPGDQREYNEWFFENIGSIYVDNNKNNWNDLSETLGATTLIDGLKGIKENGVELLDLRFDDGEGNKMTMRDRIQEVVLEQQTLKNKAHTQALKEITNAQGLWKNEVRTKANSLIVDALEDGILDEDEKIEIRDTLTKEAQDFASKGLLPYPLPGALAEIDKILPLKGRPPSGKEKGDWAEELEGYKADLSLTELPTDFLNKISGTTYYPLAVAAMAKAVNSRTDTSKSNSPINEVVTRAQEALKIALASDEDIAGDPNLDQREVKDLTSQAYDLAKGTYALEAEQLATTIMNKLREDHPDKDESWYIEQTASKVKGVLLQRPEYNDIDSYFDVGGKTDIHHGDIGWGTRVAPAAPVSFKGDGVETPYEITSNNDQGLDYFKMRNRDYFAVKGTGLEYAQENFMFNSDQFKEINTLVARPQDFDKLSLPTKTAIFDAAEVLGVSPSALIKAQISKLNNGKLDAINKAYPDWEKNLGVLDGLRSPTYSTGTDDSANNLFIYDDKNLTAEGDRGVIWETRKGNDVQSSNFIPIPVGGEVVFAGESGAYGIQVVIKADKDYPDFGVKAGDHIVTSHIALLDSDMKVGAKVRRSESMGMSGNREVSGEGSTTGKGFKPGQIHTSLYNSSGYTDKTSQYNQVKQRNFFRKAYTGLYSGD